MRPAAAAFPARLTLLGVFVATRLLARGVFGLRFFAHTLDYWQVLDPELLRHDLLRSVACLHGQPPLYNLFLGVVLRLAPAGAADHVFDALFLATSFALLLGMHALLLELGTPAPAALAAASLQALSTTWIVYESWLFYTLPTAALLTWASVWLARAARGRRRSAVAAAVAVAGVAGLRSTYHLAWVVAALALLLFVAHARPALRRTAWIASMVALCLVLALYAKNAVLVHSFSSSSWLGMSVARLTTERLDAATRAQWIRAGTLEPVAGVPPFSPLADYPAPLSDLPARTPRHPALTAPTKSDGGVNLNHAAYAPIARQYLRAAGVVIRERPDLYLSAVREAWFTWLRPPTEYDFVEDLRQRVRRWDAIHSRIMLWSPRRRGGSGPCWVLAAAALLVAVALLAPPEGQGRRRLVVAALPLLTIATNAVVGNLAEIEENNRFRVEVEPLIWALGGWAAVDLVQRLARSWGRWRSPRHRGVSRAGEVPRPAAADTRSAPFPW